MKTLAEKLESIDTRLNSIESLLKLGSSGDPFLTTEEVMATMKVCKKTLQNWRDKGDIDFLKVGRKIYYNINSFKTK